MATKFLTLKPSPIKHPWFGKVLENVGEREESYGKVIYFRNYESTNEEAFCMMEAAFTEIGDTDDDLTEFYERRKQDKLDNSQFGVGA